MAILDDLTSQPMTNEKIEEVYREAINLARSNDLLGWRGLVKGFPAWIQATLMKWREQYQRGGFQDYEAVYGAVDEAVAQLAPLFAVALAGVESKNEKFRNQRALFDDLLNMYGWDYSGLDVIVELPNTLGFVYQALHGAMCMSTGQYELALEFVDSKIKRRHDREYRMLWEYRDIMGWPDTLGGKCTDAWKYLSNGAERWKWLETIFASSNQYKASLTAYYMALNTHELAWYLTRMPEADSRLGVKADLHVPLCFMDQPPIMLDSAFRLLINERSSLPAIWTIAGVSQSDMEKHWPAWMNVCQKWLANVYPYYIGGRRKIGHEDLFVAIS